VRPEDAWVNWTPQVYGAHSIRVLVENDDAFADGMPGNNLATLAVFIDRDTDHDGVPDREDDDQDNDLILNVDEGKKGTDPLRADTDGDGVNDLLDAFPLDPRRTILPPPVTRTTPPVTAPVPARRPASPSVATQPISSSVGAGIVVGAAVTSTVIDVSFDESTSTPMVLSEAIQYTTPTVAGESDRSPSSTNSSSETSFGVWSVLLGGAALLSLAAAGNFIWLGRV
jgi:hypothetical protein